MATLSTIVSEFQIITEGNLKAIPYVIQQVTPIKKSTLKGRLISLALLNLYKRTTWGIKPRVVSAPPMKPSASCQTN